MSRDYFVEQTELMPRVVHVAMTSVHAESNRDVDDSAIDAFRED